jgi:hypothetical protein
MQVGPLASKIQFEQKINDACTCNDGDKENELKAMM